MDRNVCSNVNWQAPSRSRYLLALRRCRRFLCYFSFFQILSPAIRNLGDPKHRSYDLQRCYSKPPEQCSDENLFQWRVHFRCDPSSDLSRTIGIAVDIASGSARCQYAQGSREFHRY